MSTSQLPAAEQALVADVSGDTLMDYTRQIAQWVRLSGSEDEAKAFAYVADICRSFGMRVEQHAADALVSWPGKATLEVLSPERRALPCITHSFAVSTPPEGVEGDVVEERDTPADALRGKIVLSDGLANPGKGMAAEAAGVLAQININDRHTHEMIISPVWGSPTPQTAHLLPNLVSISVNEADGAELRRLATLGPLRVRIVTEVDTRWRTIPVLTAEIGGAADRFVLFSGHIDSWHYGAMDNGTANATMLEVGRLLSARKDQLRRGLRLAFWSGHSHARYSGSTWYADHFWPELHARCVGHVNVDSVGGIGATILSEGNAMAETVGFAGRAILEVAEQELEYKRFGRAGDQSFNGIGLPAMFMSLSGQPAGGPSGAVEEQMARLLGTGRGRSGGLGWWWHTTEDTIDKIDRDFLVRDASIYALTLWRLCTEAILPFDYGATADELLGVLRDLANVADDRLDLGALVAEAEALRDDTARLGAACAAGGDAARIAALNDCIMALGRCLTPINYTASGEYDHDLALPAQPIPSLQPLRQLAALDPASDEAHLLRTQLVRARNRVWHGLHRARGAIAEVVSSQY
jgi:hypothetical protein